MILLPLLFLTLHQPVTASDWTKIESLAQSGHEKDALQLILQSEARDFYYYYNLGVVHGKLGNTGASYAFFTKACSLEPSNVACQQSLDSTLSRLVGKVGDSGLDPSASPLEKWVDTLLSPLASKVLIIITLLLASFFYYSRKRSTKKRAASFSAVLFLSLIHLFLFSWRHTHSTAIVIEDQMLYTGPAESFIPLESIPAGVKLRLSGERIKGWVQVRYSQEGIGWIPESRLLLL